tara:strand:+ start:219 stop:620 length:402 start_codon:yes stop_codon:yes gene_type:complete
VTLSSVRETVNVAEAITTGDLTVQIGGERHDEMGQLREMVGKIVDRLGHLVSKAVDGNEGIAIANNQEIDVIILDVQMPNKDGLQTLDELRQNPRYNETPIIMLTSVGDGDIVKRSIQGRRLTTCSRMIPSKS